MRRTARCVVAVGMAAAMALAAIACGANTSAGPAPYSIPAPATQLPWPISQTHYISYAGKGYGCSGHAGRDYYAIDFETGAGAQVAAVMGGVAHTFTDAGYGNTVWIAHGYNIVTMYAHLGQFNVFNGQTVSANQVIGLTGSSGNATGPHLHYAMHSHATGPYNGNPVKPEPMSRHGGFGQYGYCTGRSSPWYTSAAP